MKFFGTIFKKSNPGIHVGSKGGDVLSKRVWGDCNDISSRKTILWSGLEFFVKSSNFLFSPILEFQKIYFFSKIWKSSLNVQALFQEHCDRHKARISNEILWFRPLPAEWSNVEKCKFSRFSVNQQWKFNDPKVCSLSFLTHFRT